MSARAHILAVLGLAAGVSFARNGAAQSTAVPRTNVPPLMVSARTPLRSVRIEPAIRGEDPWARVGIRPGAMVDDALLRGAIARAFESGTFAALQASVRPMGDGVELVLRGERRSRVAEVRFEGLERRPLEAVRADFGLIADQWLTDEQINDRRVQVLDGYRAAGFRGASAEVTQSRDTSSERAGARDDVRLVVRVREGEPTRVAGLRVFAAGADRTFGPRLCETLSLWTVTAADGEAACRPVLGDGEVADDRALRESAETLRGALRQAGYYNARIEGPTTIPLGSADGRAPRVELRFTVALGPAFSVEFDGVRRGDARALRDALRLEEERAIDETTLGIVEVRVREWYVRRAFADVRVACAIEAIDPRRARLRIAVVEGSPVYVRTVSFVGAQAFSYASLREELDELLRAELPGGNILVAPSSEALAAIDAVDHGRGGGPRMPLTLAPERTFLAEVYQDAARRMVARYRESGYLDATVELDGAAARDRDEAGRPVLDVTFRVVERAQVSLVAVAFEGSPAIPSESLAQTARLRLGGPISLAEVSAARDRLAEQHREAGYNYARVVSAIDRSPNGQFARARFTITPGALVKIGRIDIRGLRALPEEFIRDRLGLREGEEYRPSAARDAQRRLGELGYFSSVSVSLEDPDVESERKTLVVLLSETGGNLEARLGASLYEPIRGSVQWTRRNVLRTSVSMTATLQGGLVFPLLSLIDRGLYPTLQSLQWYERVRGRAALSLQLPPLRALGTDVRPGVDLSVSRTVDLQFAINGVDIGASVSARPRTWFTLTPIADFQINDLQLFGAETIEALIRSADPGEQLRLGRLLLLPRGTTFLTSGRLTAAFNFTDQLFNPQNGYFLSLTGELVGVLAFLERQTPAGAAQSTPPGNTLRATVSFSAYYSPSLGRLGTWTLSTNVRVGANATFDSCNRVTYPNRQFFLGGADTLRGWLQDSVVPADVLSPVAVSGCPNLPPPTLGSETLVLSQRSGDAFVLWRSDLRIPIGASGIAANLFVDVGNLWKDVRAIFSVPSVRVSPGMGVRYVTPIGPVGLDLGFNTSPSTLVGKPEPLMVLSFSFSST
jgi:outer membrane protein insertion porin family